MPERRAIALIGLAIRIHGGRDGDGLFTGTSRYAVLEQRLRLAAERSRSVRQCWDTLCRSLGWSLGIIRWDEPALALVAPRDDDPEVLRILADRSQSCVMIARYLIRKGLAEPQAPEESRAEWPVLADPLDIFDLQQSAAEPASATEKPNDVPAPSDPIDDLFSGAP